MNLERRHLTYDQRVGLALKVRPALQAEAERREKAGVRIDPAANSQQGQEKGRSAEQAAKQLGVGPRAVYEMAAAAKERVCG